MEILKSKMTIILIIMILAVSYIGGIENNQLEENDHQIEINV